MTKKYFLCFVFSSAEILSLYAQVHNIKDYGAIGDGTTFNTKSIQSAIDNAAKKGGGKIIFPAGRYLTGTLKMKSNIELHLMEGAVLLGSTQWTDYEKDSRWYALILANGADHIAITGKGTIDGQGRELAKDVRRMVDEGVLQDKLRSNRPDESKRPQLIEFSNCQYVDIKNITLKDASCWVQTYRNCTYLTMDSIVVNSTAFWNNDGIDVLDCNHVKITNSNINSGDDGICLKSYDTTRMCENFIIANCKVRSSATAVKFGTPSFGGFRKIDISNIYVYDTYRTGIALEVVDGGIIEDITISNMTVKNSGGAIFMKIGQRRKTAPPGILRRVHIKGMKVDVPTTKPDAGYEMAEKGKNFPHNAFPSSIVGLPGAFIEDVTIENVDINFCGGGTKENACVSLDSLHTIPEVPYNYPEFSMMGELPAWGFYVRHAKNLKFKNINLSVKKDDFRSAFVFDDVNKLSITNCTIQPPYTTPAIVLKTVTDEKFNEMGFLKTNKSIIKKM
jgi:polygalacturonase